MRNSLFKNLISGIMVITMFLSTFPVMSFAVSSDILHVDNFYGNGFINSGTTRQYGKIYSAYNPQIVQNQNTSAVGFGEKAMQIEKINSFYGGDSGYSNLCNYYNVFMLPLNSLTPNETYTVTISAYAPRFRICDEQRYYLYAVNEGKLVQNGLSYTNVLGSWSMTTGSWSVASLYSYSFTPTGQSVDIGMLDRSKTDRATTLYIGEIQVTNSTGNIVYNFDALEGAWSEGGDTYVPEKGVEPVETDYDSTVYNHEDVVEQIGSNLISDGGFENTVLNNGIPSNTNVWFEYNGGKGPFYSITNEEAYSGTKSAKLVPSIISATQWGWNAFYVGTYIDVEQLTDYTLTFYTKTKNSNKWTMQYNVGSINDPWQILANTPAAGTITNEGVLESSQWEFNKLQFNSGYNEKIFIRFRENCWSGMDAPIYIDDVLLYKSDKSYIGAQNTSVEDSGVVQSSFYVSLNGSDVTGSGSIDAPWATIEKAKSYISDNKLNENMTGDIFVYIDEGEYYLNNTLTFSENDSGSNGYSVIYKNWKETGSAHIIGGKRVVGWEQYSGNIYRANVGTDYKFSTLYENDKRAVMARYPNKGDNEGLIMAQSNYLWTKGTGVGNDTFYYDTAKINTSDWNLRDAQVFMWSGGHVAWMSDTVPIYSIDPQIGKVVLKYKTRYNMEQSGYYWGNSRFYFQGVLGLLDTEGEWYFDSNEGYLYYWAMDGNINNQKIIMPTMKRTVALAGSSEVSRVNHIKLIGLTIECSDFTEWARNAWNSAGDSGYSHKYPAYDRQITLPQNRQGLVFMRNTNNIVIADCRIAKSGYSAIYLSFFNKNNLFSGNLIENSGKDGIQADGKYPGEGDVCRNNTFEDLKIQYCGELAGDGSGIQLGNSGYNVVKHCEITDCVRFGLALSGGWKGIADNEIYGKNNYFSYIHIARTCQDSGDTGAIYTFMADDGTAPWANATHFNQIFIEDTYAHSSMPDYATNSLFNDEASGRMNFVNVYAKNSSSIPYRANAYVSPQFVNCNWLSTGNSDTSWTTSGDNSNFDINKIDFKNIGITANFPEEYLSGVCSINNLVVTNEYGSEFEKLNNAGTKLNAAAYVKNETNSTKKVAVTMALYNGGCLKAVNLASDLVESGTAKSISAAMTDLDARLKGYTLKVFAWDADSFEPLCNAFEASYIQDPPVELLSDTDFELGAFGTWVNDRAKENFVFSSEENHTLTGSKCIKILKTDNGDFRNDNMYQELQLESNTAYELKFYSKTKCGNGNNVLVGAGTSAGNYTEYIGKLPIVHQTTDENGVPIDGTVETPEWILNTYTFTTDSNAGNYPTRVSLFWNVWYDEAVYIDDISLMEAQ